MPTLWLVVAIGAGVAVIVVAVLGLLARRWWRTSQHSQSRLLVERVIKLPLRMKGRLAWRLFRERRIPLLARAIIPAVVLHLAMPLDIIPDFIPVLGYLDDIFVVLVGVWALMRFAPRAVVEEHVAALEREREATG
ncbi:MAG: DUF1232 domain-containing protein [Candidatus Bathyarchaeota archaeon]|nr:DUF1232 domain-containing protein [Candidatus Bathyarchaeota archaeon]